MQLLGSLTDHRGSRSKPKGAAAWSPPQQPKLARGWNSAEGLDCNPQGRNLQRLVVGYESRTRDAGEMASHAFDTGRECRCRTAVERTRHGPGAEPILRL